MKVAEKDLTIDELKDRVAQTEVTHRRMKLEKPHCGLHRGEQNVKRKPWKPSCEKYSQN